MSGDVRPRDEARNPTPTRCRLSPVRIAESGKEYVRGVAGGLLFALPLLLTREVWNIGARGEPGRMLAGIAGSLVLLLLFNRVAGLREDASWKEVVIDSIEEYGLGVVIAAFVLFATGRLSTDDSLATVAGSLTVGAISTSLGTSFGTAQLGENPEGVHEGIGAQLAVALCGAVIVAANIAPTQEVAIVAAEAGPGRLLLWLIVSMAGVATLAGAGVLRKAEPFVKDGIIPRRLFAVAATWLVATGASVGLLAFFGRFEGEGLRSIVGQTVVLSIPAAIGATLGRALLGES